MGVVLLSSRINRSRTHLGIIDYSLIEWLNKIFAKSIEIIGFVDPRGIIAHSSNIFTDLLAVRVLVEAMV